MVRDILRLGDERLYEVSQPVTAADEADLKGWVADLHDTLMAYRAAYGAGRAVAAVAKWTQYPWRLSSRKNSTKSSPAGRAGGVKV